MYFKGEMFPPHCGRLSHSVKPRVIQVPKAFALEIGSMASSQALSLLDIRIGRAFLQAVTVGAT